MAGRGGGADQAAVRGGREHVGKGGIVREQAGREIAIERVKECVVGLGATGVEVIESPITGMEGNHEYLLHAWFE
jgi:23S rRNA (cytidine1920-2'-O)/16S rRNA (cytidine1409-2'-O)-methyltransferase